MNFTSKRMRRRIGGALAGGGLALAGAALGLTLGLSTPDVHADGAKNGAVNYVRGISHDAVSGILLDEEIVLRFNAAVLPSSVGPDTVLLRTGPTNGEQARGTFIVGGFLNDKSVQRRVTIRPEAIREYYQQVRLLRREDAQRLTNRLIKRIERRGRYRKLRSIDRALRQFFGPSYGAGTRLDDELVFATYPPPLLAGDDLIPYRQTIAGNDELWQAHFNGDQTVFDQLAANSEWERFFHEIDPATGVQGATSVLRLREHRRVLINRRSKTRVMFVPEIPIRADLADTGFKAGRAYSVTVPGFQPGVFNTVLTQRGQRSLRQVDGRDFSTLFTTVPSGSPRLFLDSESREGVATLQKPRVVNVTPPNGETFVDQTTDWEDPDNRYAVALTARRTFTVRLRFAQPLDPRTVNPTNFTISKTKANPGPGETNLDPPIPVAVGTFLNQNRLGIVEVELTPATNLDPASEYEVRVRGVVKSLGGELLNADKVSTFIVGEGPPPRTDINEDFSDTVGRAPPLGADTFGQITTALWAAPPLYDPDQTGKCIAAFMSLIGTGAGAPADPTQPLPFDPDDPATFPVTDLVLSQPDNGVITFSTEGLDPNDQITFGQQVEYHYQRVRMQQGSTANVIGRFPLIIRSQSEIVLESAVILCAGGAGQYGRENEFPTSGGPTGGLGGSAGPGAYRGGDGAFAPLTDAAGVPILDGNGNFTFDQAKFDGSDGLPGFTDSGPGTTGGGAGGFSGDHLAPNEDVDMMPPVDPQVTPARQREGGGGGGHATVGGNSDNYQATQQLHPGGYFGGTGGNPYGSDDFSEQPHLPLQGVPNALTGAPRLTIGAGGAGGGGGGGDDNPDNNTQAMDTVGHEDSGGGGGGGGGGAVQLSARQSADSMVPGGIRITGSVIDCSGGASGGTETFDGSNTGSGAPGGSGSGGSIWLQCIQDDIEIGSGTSLLCGGGDNSAVGTLGPAETDDPPGSQPQFDVEGQGGKGGDGYIRMEDRDGVVTIPGAATVEGVLITALLTPDLNGDYPTHPGVPMVVSDSVAYSIWYNSLLDTPTYVPRFDDAGTPEQDGSVIVEASGGTADVLVRTAPNNINNTGHPDPDKITPWTPLLDVGTISDRRFLQFRIDFTLPLSYDIGDPRPYADRIQIDIELN